MRKYIFALERFVDLHRQCIAKEALGIDYVPDIATWIVGYNPMTCIPEDSDIVYGVADYCAFHEIIEVARMLRTSSKSLTDISLDRFADIIIEMNKVAAENADATSKRALANDIKITLDKHNDTGNSVVFKDMVDVGASTTVRGVKYNYNPDEIISLPTIDVGLDNLRVTIEGPQRKCNDGSYSMSEITFSFVHPDSCTLFMVLKIDLGCLINTHNILRSDACLDITVIPHTAYAEIKLCDNTTKLVHVFQKPYADLTKLPVKCGIPYSVSKMPLVTCD